MGVNIWVTGGNGLKIPLCWGVGMVPGVTDKNVNVIHYLFGSGLITVRETPAEIAALVAAAERKQSRERIAAQLMAADIAGGASRGY